MSPLRIAPVLALLILGCARGDSAESSKAAAPPAQLPAATAVAVDPVPAPGAAGSVAPATHGQAAASASATKKEDKLDDAPKKPSDGAGRAPPPPAATSTVQKPKCNCTPGDPTCTC